MLALPSRCSGTSTCVFFTYLSFITLIGANFNKTFDKSQIYLQIFLVFRFSYRPPHRSPNAAFANLFAWIEKYKKWRINIPDNRRDGRKAGGWGAAGNACVWKIKRQRKKIRFKRLKDGVVAAVKCLHCRKSGVYLRNSHREKIEIQETSYGIEGGRCNKSFGELQTFNVSLRATE